MELPNHDCIRFLMNHSYFKNFPPAPLLSDYNYQFPLHEFICYCVGYIDGYRTVQCIRILNKIPSNKISSILIQWYSPNFEENKSCQFWVNSGVCLKYNFFKFEDKLSFFRSTFIYSPKLNQYFRLSSLYHFLVIPERQPKNELIFHAPQKSYLYKKNLHTSIENVNERKKKEVKKTCQSFLKKHNLANFLQTNFPNLFYELEQIVHK